MLIQYDGTVRQKTELLYQHSVLFVSAVTLSSIRFYFTTRCYMTDFERDFKGVWIAKDVWLDTRLNALEKIILTEIDSLDNGERGCWASNEYLAEFCQCSESKVSKAISKLIDLDYIYLRSFDGRRRELKSRLSNFTKQSSKKYEAATEILPANNIDNNTLINNDSEYKEIIIEKMGE